MPESGSTVLRGFTAHTTPWLTAQLRGLGYSYGYYRTQAEPNGVITLERRRALALANRLKETDEEQFPGGKWATIQHVEACIAADG